MDIVKVLKNIKHGPEWHGWNAAIEDAIDEIERLREANSFLRAVVGNFLANEVAHVKVFKPKKEKSK